jgi:hypothetical protein
LISPLQSKFKFKKPVIKDDGARDLDDGDDDLGDDMDGNADIADMINNGGN